MDREEPIEALLLDYLEGRLGDAERKRVEAYLLVHPELREALDESPSAVLQPSERGFARRDDLKLPVGSGTNDTEIREMLYVSAVDDELTKRERKIFDQLMLRDEFRREYESWSRTKLSAEVASLDQSALYRTGDTSPLSESTYEDHLIALAEGLLDEAQVERLEAFVMDRPDGKREFRIARSLRLSPPTGIFYPDRSELYRHKQKPVVWLYRAAAIAVMAVVAWWITNSGPSNNLAQKDMPTAMTPRPVPLLVTETKAHATLAIPRRPAATSVVTGAVASEPNTTPPQRNHSKPPHIGSARAELEPEHMATKQAATVSPSDVSDMTLATPSPKVPELIAEGASAEPSSDTYTPLSTWAAEKALKKLTGRTPSEDGQPILALADRLTEKAGQLLDAEVGKTTAKTSSGTRQTFSVRIGGFGVERTAVK